MITCRVYGDGALREEVPFDPGVVRTAHADGHRVWLDVVDPTDEELRSVQSEIGLHELAVEDSSKWGQRAKVDFYPGHLFLVAHGVGLDGAGELVDREVHLFSGERILATIRREPRFEFGAVRARLAARPELAREGTGYLLYLFLDEVVDGYLDLVERFEDLADDVEDDLGAREGGAGDDDRQLASRIFRLRQQVVRFRRLAAPMREMVDLLLEDGTVVTPPLVPYYRDVLDHLIRMLELTDNVRDLLTSARELQLAQASNRLNVVMKALSAWAAIILIPTMIAGIYGMNFRHMPELDWKLGYPFAIGTMALAAFVLYRVFKRRDWL